MCGIAGFFMTKDYISSEKMQNYLHSMTDAISHRGPDNYGYWTDSDNGIGLAHRRLTVIDLTETGNQPMISVSGRFIVVFNGEIYNHLYLRKKLENEGKINTKWRGSSDTETLLACFDSWGIEDTLNQSVGMFAIAVWDCIDRELILIRDRFGEKPLYYGWQRNGCHAAFLFGSELSALKKHPAFVSKINRDALTLYMRYNCIGGDHSIYLDIYKLLPGSYLKISCKNPDPIVHTWWSIPETIKRAVNNRFSGSPDDAVRTLEDLLQNTIKDQMISDVPLGAFLSGGIDSSTIVTLMQMQSKKPIHTFSIGFYEKKYNEAKHAKLISQYLGTEHTELYITPKQVLEIIPKLPTLYNEPFSDSSQIPTFLVSHLTKQYVTVALSGDAGDELFCGYTRYKMTIAIWKKISYIPQSMRRIIGTFITSLSPNTWNKFDQFFSTSRIGDKLHKGADLLCHNTIEQLYKGMVSHWDDPKNIVLNSNEPKNLFSWDMPEWKELNDIERMMALDILTYLPDDNLVKLDRASMANSLEVRVPFLDHRIMEFAWSLPLHYKLRNGVTKWPLREILYKNIPSKLINREKMGFSIPIDHWLRSGPLRDWAESLLSVARIKSDGILNPNPIRKKWNEHISGKRNWQYLLWDVLMFQAWLENQNSSS